jgi:ABC-type Fe3+ transport system permease subunit
MMQDIVASFTTVMTWVVLLLCLVVVVLLGLAAWHLPSHRRRALLGVVLMALVVPATGVGWFLLSRKAQSWSRLLLPLAAPLLLLSLYRLSFPPRVPGSHRQTRHQVLLLLLTMGALLAAGGLVLLDLLFP